MNAASLITDNIAELLVKIIEFTRVRHKILARNIYYVESPGFIPKDLVTDEFSNLLNCAIDEHIKNQRLLLRDTENIRFGTSGSFTIQPVVDRYAQELLNENQDEYIQLQINKLLENLLNQRIAAALLGWKQKMVSVFRWR
jgi:flagellar basal body rod protein FlgB